MLTLLSLLVTSLVLVSSVQQPPPVVSGLTAEQVRTSFLHSGFQVEDALHWDWLSPPVASFRVWDHANDRVLLVLVYADVAAVRQDIALPGYGPTVLWHNVALAESNLSELSARYVAERDHDMQVATEQIPAWRMLDAAVRAPVDADLLSALFSSDRVDL
jgi:hypothetical protein